MAGSAESITTRERDSSLGAQFRALMARLGLGQRGSVQAWSVTQKFLLALMVVYLAKQAIFVVVFPPFTGHDEVAHYSYLRTVATEGRIPILLEDRLHDDLYPYCRYVLQWAPCDPDNPEWVANPPTLANYGEPFGVQPVGMQYAANHPPLYYIMMAPLYWLSDRFSPEFQQYLLRVAAIPFGIATVMLAYMLARTLFSGDRFLAVTVPAFVAFQPQISYEAAMANNDIVSIALFSWILYLLVVGIRDRFPYRTCAVIGLALGLALLAKGTSLTIAPVIAGALVLALPLPWRDLGGWAKRLMLIAGPAIVLTAPWFIFLFRTYGNFSGLEQVEELQFWNEPEGGFFELLVNRDFAVMRFHETWGYFGWRLIPLSNAMLWGIGLPLIVAVGGLVQYALTVIWKSAGGSSDPVLKLRRWQIAGLLLMTATCAITYLAVVQFGTRFALTQARYYFPAINAAALLLMLGLRTIIPVRYHGYGQAGVLVGLVVMNILIFTLYVIPYWNPPASLW